MKHFIFASVFALLSNAAFAAGDVTPPKHISWPFDGISGHVDEQAAQRGFQVYKEVCASCHGLSRVAIRNLQAIGFSEAEVKSLAATYTVKDGPNDEGEMFERPGKPSDRFPSPFANEQAARAANNGAYPPDLSLIVKARADGANYLYSLLTGYQEPPAGFELTPGMHYNSYFPGHQIAMPKPMSDDQVSYADGTAATLDQMAQDVTVFLQWAAEPEMERRKRMGLKVLAYLAAFTAIMFVVKKRVWAKLK